MIVVLKPDGLVLCFVLISSQRGKLVPKAGQKQDDRGLEVPFFMAPIGTETYRQ
jgi:hypothetical protein